ncbi:hypothetical protein P154DRAFT_623846, partial [Amniculicola lignicola CBS 123094]
MAFHISVSMTRHARTPPQHHTRDRSQPQLRPHPPQRLHDRQQNRAYSYSRAHNTTSHSQSHSHAQPPPQPHPSTIRKTMRKATPTILKAKPSHIHPPSHPPSHAPPHPRPQPQPQHPTILYPRQYLTPTPL